MGSDLIVEEVPPFTQRYSDHIIQGSNNTIAIYGTDRAKNGPASNDDGYGGNDDQGKKSGTIHIIAGRKAPDPDLKDDDSFMYLSMKTDVDENLAIDSIGGSNQKAAKAGILKSDCIRIVGRKDIKISASDDQKHFIFMDGSKMSIQFGDKIKIDITDSLVVVEAPELHLKGDCKAPWTTMFDDLCSALESHDHITGVGPSGKGNSSPTGDLGVTTARLTFKNTWKQRATE